MDTGRLSYPPCSPPGRMPMEELFGAVDLVPGAAAAAPGQTGGTLAELEPGTYFLFCPVGGDGEIPHHLQGMITTITVA
ncbi:hypothetical protein I4I73_30980 [Pseudonocardia sp. KRD-184]|uniref:hypothetical protein n=1 Tax=Pseudonocardia oceani TaxID=2792013 RepID=UPI001C49FB95|nr:hypothetical protein [Pseudonocardia oceani]MBW0093886.1 hypothetical protein [Pseudonocardia oceani]MBW0100410.1 hypothetical protein [Pseudonocardia oceani]MBW0113225.1 hypothetical protein [Pseudonocardia oceani]MBW0125930.1 hypothetical protein [Pseudonocardia oceani]